MSMTTVRKCDHCGSEIPAARTGRPNHWSLRGPWPGIGGVKEFCSLACISKWGLERIAA